MEQVKQLISDITNNNIKPVYFLAGEEPYYIDKITDFIAENVLPEHEREFNQLVLYGHDVSVAEIINQAKRFPMMAERQVVIVKEAQALVKTIEQLAPYVNNPQPTTVLVICYKYKKIDKRKALYKAVKEKGVYFESKKLYDNQIPDWIKRYVANKKYRISDKSCMMLAEFLGNDLGKIENELQKLMMIIPPEVEITPELIEKNIGISKDFNNFELQKAIAQRDFAKATRIINYFAQNPKDNPLVLTVSALYSFFTNLLRYHGLHDHSKKTVSAALKISPWFVIEYQIAAKNYPMRRVSEILSYLRETDTKGKGVGASATPSGELLKELIVKIFN